MNVMFENFINGNLEDAKRQSKRYSLWRIYEAGQEIWSRNKAAAVAIYLKHPNQRTFQKACDAA